MRADETTQLARHGEHDVEVPHREQALTLAGRCGSDFGRSRPRDEPFDRTYGAGCELIERSFGVRA